VLPKKALDGYRVVDFSSVVAGPWCTRLLADAGAEVIKIEPVGMGDVLRFIAPIAEGESRVYAHFNCGKKNVCIDLKSVEGIHIARELIAKTDIVVENFRPGVMKRLGLDYESVSREREELIYCSISGFGQTGPMAQAPAYAPVLHALSGFDHVQNSVQDDPALPLNSAVMVADILAATYAFGAIQTAVVARERFNQGAHVDVTLMESMMTMVAIQYMESQWDTPVPTTVFKPLVCADGCVMIPLVSFRNYQVLFPLIDKPEWLSDERFKTFEGVIAARAEILQELAAWGRNKTMDQLVDIMQEGGLPCARYQSPSEVLEDEVFIERGSFTPLSDGVGEFKVINMPFTLTDLDRAASQSVALSGQHTDEVLTTLAGRSADEISRLRADQVIA
jgi:crotonobetainyl-CoA:carnitine CoA-transferase CaiB-like acyl-CoA transferase